MDLNGIKVLVVEDDFNVAHSLATLLESYGAEIAGPVPSVEKAVALLGRARFDVALLDVQLRGETVVAVAERLSSDGVPIVFLTGFRDLSQLPEPLQSYPHLHKPVDPDVMVELIRTAAGRG
jgi:DNA-binding NtrC family response regulator